MSDPFRTYDVWLSTPPWDKTDEAWEDYLDAFLTDANIARFNELKIENGWEDVASDEAMLAKLAAEGEIPSFDTYYQRRQDRG